MSLDDLGVTENLLDGLESRTEGVVAELFEASTGDGGVEVDTLEERVCLDGGRGGRAGLTCSQAVRRRLRASSLVART